jgi:nuclear transport factor 2 (NTF2) superfamily protein
MKLRYIAMTMLLLAIGQNVRAGVLPDDRTDLLYHRYEGGGVEIDGPSLLVRKKVGKSLSFVGNYYVDMVSSASIDVITTASPYTEERTQWSLGMDYLRGDTTVSINYTNSVESDFDATTYSLSISQDMFGDMTTLTLSYALGDDVVGKSDDPEFSRDNTRQHYGIGLTQILTRNLITTVNVETITDEGFLNNPYRSVRFFDPLSAVGYSYEPELYPATRTTNAVGIRARYFLPYRAAAQLEYRFFTDTWGITSHTAAIGYVHPWRDWTFKAKYRWHDQNGADFYQDIFSRSEATNFRGRDKELSALTSNTLELGVSYAFLKNGWNFVDKGSVNFTLNLLQIDFDEFSDVSTGAPLGEEPLYSLDANVFQLFVSFWY